jgi:hypothetical protein
VLFLPLSFSSLFSVLVPSLLFSSSPCVLPLFFLCSAGLRLPLLLKRFQRNKVMNSCFLNGAVFLTKMAIYNCAPVKYNWTPLFRRSLQQGRFILFYSNIEPNQLQILVMFQLSPCFP